MHNLRDENQEPASEKIRELLNELRALITKHTKGRSVEELAAMGAWSQRLPRFDLPLIDALLKENVELENSFDAQRARQNLCTPENLDTLLKGETEGLARKFAEYFSLRNLKKYRILFPCDALDSRGVASFTDSLSQFELRSMTAEERAAFPPKWGELTGKLQFVVDVLSGDDAAATRLARATLILALTPYYIHRALQRDPWWRVRVERRILSPRALWMCFEKGARRTVGVSWTLDGAKGRVRDLFHPSPPIDVAWHRITYSYVGAVEEGKDLSPTDEPLALCAYWIGKAEWENDLDTAFLKYNVAWEALFPLAGEADRKLSMLLLLTCAGAEDSLCVETVGQGLRLRDRRHSYAHPRIEDDRLWLTVDRNLQILRQSLLRSLAMMMRIKSAMELNRGATWTWNDILSETRNALLAKKLDQVDNVVSIVLSELLLIDRDGKLIRAGQRVRAAMLALESLQCGKDPKNATRFAIRSLLTARLNGILETHLYAARSLLLWLKRVGKKEFREIWNGVEGSGCCPTKRDIEVEIEAIHRKYRKSFSSVGCAVRDLPTDEGEDSRNDHC